MRTPETFVFDVTVSVRKRLHLSGPRDRATARRVLHEALLGGLPLDAFAVRDAAGHAVEEIVGTLSLVNITDVVCGCDDGKGAG